MILNLNEWRITDMKKNKLVSMFMCVIVIFAALPIHATNPSKIYDEKVTMDDINNSKLVTIYISDETLFFLDNLLSNGKINPMRYGSYPIYTRVRVVQSSSNGLIERDSKLGTYSSISSIVLSFSGYAPAMTVSTILSVVDLVVGNSTYVQGKTYISYVQYVKNGEARWSNDSAYSTCSQVVKCND